MQSKEELKKWLIIILTVMIGYWLINNYIIVLNFIGKIVNVSLPFLIGIALAYILNIPMTKIEKILKRKIKANYKRRIISIILSLILLILIIAFVAFMLIPELIQNIELLIKNIPTLIENTQNWILNLLDQYPKIQIEINNTFKENANIEGMIIPTLNYLLNGSINIISSLVSGIITIFTALVFAIYMLAQKEKLLTSIKKILKAYLKKQHTNKIFRIATITNNTFTKFISGQCVDAVILGIIFFIVLTIFRFPYALIISVLITITALIPVFGAFIAMAIGAILIAITSPIRALIFILVFLVIQQIEGNFIYPKVVGKSVGLSPIWTLLAITVGGGLFGVLGMLFALPIASVIYSLIVEDASKRLEKQKENIT